MRTGSGLGCEEFAYVILDDVVVFESSTVQGPDVRDAR
jgi:hypothetical protein